MADLARTALLGAPRRSLLQKATQLLLDAMDAEACGIYEYLPGGHDLLLRAAAVGPGGRRGLTTIDVTGVAALPAASGGSVPLAPALVVPIGVSPPFGCVAVRARAHGGFGEKDRHFAVQAAASSPPPWSA